MSRIVHGNSAFGVTLLAGLLLSASAVAQNLVGQPGAATVDILYSFQSSDDGYFPAAGITLDSLGNLYSTTAAGGISRQNGGTVFRLSPDGSGAWNKSILYTFQGYRDGKEPLSGVVSDAQGNLYGTTSGGGPSSFGVVFQLVPIGNGSYYFKNLHSFTNSDGYDPDTGVILDKYGNLYGTARFGGAYTYGTLFKLTRQPNGSFIFSVLHDFNAATDGSDVFGLVSDPLGNLYGTTAGGGPSNNGVVFELTRGPSGTWTESVLHYFTGGSDGGAPQAGLVLDKYGNLYGTTYAGGGNGCAGGCGTVFQLKHSSGSGWTENILYSFHGSDGEYPISPLVFDSAGNLYGTTSLGGSLACPAFGCGTIFKMTHSAGNWNYKQIYAFQSTPDGEYPHSGLTVDSAGNLYGTCTQGGAEGLGIVYEIPASLASSNAQ